MNPHPVNTRFTRAASNSTCLALVVFAVKAFDQSVTCSVNNFAAACRTPSNSPMATSRSRTLAGNPATHRESAGSTCPPVAMLYSTSRERLRPSSSVALLDVKPASLRTVCRWSRNSTYHFADRFVFPAFVYVALKSL